jgi:predicted small metal-binding protein
MIKTVYCRDLGFDCAGIVHAETEEELLPKVAEHALAVHNITTITPELLKQVKSVIRQEDAAEPD